MPENVPPKGPSWDDDEPAKPDTGTATTLTEYSKPIRVRKKRPIGFDLVKRKRREPRK